MAQMFGYAKNPDTLLRIRNIYHIFQLYCNFAFGHFGHTTLKLKLIFDPFVVQNAP